MMTAEFASITKEGIEIHPTIADLPEFPIPSDYEYDKSTEYNYKIDEDDDKRECVHREYKGDFESESAKYRGKFKDKFVGRYIEERKQMDYNYHKIYTPSRQLYQDEIISRFLETLIRDLEHNTYCDVPEYNWIVFTAGPMVRACYYHIDVGSYTSMCYSGCWQKFYDGMVRSPWIVSFRSICTSRP